MVAKCMSLPISAGKAMCYGERWHCSWPVQASCHLFKVKGYTRDPKIRYKNLISIDNQC